MALQVRRDAFPEQWATRQNNLAVAYSNRIRREKAENIERAIVYCTISQPVNDILQEMEEVRSSRDTEI